MDLIKLFSLAVAPGIALALSIYLTDRFDREPISLLVIVFLFGALSTIPTLLLEKLLTQLNIFTGLFSVAYTAFIVAGFSEELLKRSVVLKFAYGHQEFNEKLDGIVYAVFATLGFATVENVIYVVFRFPETYFVGISRGLLSVPAHMLFAITMGYYLSLARFTDDENDTKNFMRKSLTRPIILHGVFDFILMAKIPLLMLGLIPFVVYMWYTNLKKLNIYYRESKNMNNQL